MTRDQPNDAVVVATARSPIGRAHKGSLVDYRADELLSDVLVALMGSLPQMRPADVADVICGNVAQSGETGFCVARTATILAGFPTSLPGTTVNRFCASGLQAVRMAAHAIAAGEGDAYIACGVEKASAPPRDPDAPPPPRWPTVGPGQLNPRLLPGTDLPTLLLPMGETAEIVAQRFKVSREDQDSFAKLSQDRTIAAQDAGFFTREITPVRTPAGDLVSDDDSPRRGTTLEGLAKLQPVFRADGSVTAGNSCPMNDGAAAAMLTSRQFAAERGIQPRARIVATEVSGNDPEIMGVAPIDAVSRLLARTGLTISDIDLVELNEAFAAQVLPVADSLGIDIDRQLNVHGGAIALGHPFGMTGVRLLGTLVNGLETVDGTLGIETMCAAGGMAMAVLVERL